MKSITEALKNRYTTKVYDSNKKISKEDFAEIENILQLSPTSTNLQPLHFIIADDNEGKKRIAKAASGVYSFNEEKILNASHVIVFCSKVIVEDEHLEKVLEKEDKDGRYVEEEIKKQVQTGRSNFLKVHRFDIKDEPAWHQRQSYITFGAVLLGAAMLGIDATPMEGINTKILSEEFNLKEKNLAANTVITLGYHKDDDFNLNLPKSRLSKEEIISKA